MLGDICRLFSFPAFISHRCVSFLCYKSICSCISSPNQMGWESRWWWGGEVNLGHENPRHDMHWCLTPKVPQYISWTISTEYVENKFLMIFFHFLQFWLDTFMLPKPCMAEFCTFRVLLFDILAFQISFLKSFSYLLKIYQYGVMIQEKKNQEICCWGITFSITVQFW